MLIQNNGAMLESYQRRLSDQDALIERLTERYGEVLDAKEKITIERAALASDAEERTRRGEVEAAKELAALERRQTLFAESVSTIKTTLPLLIQHIAQGKAATTPQETAASMAYAAVTDEQLAKMKTRMPPSAYEEYAENVQKARAAATTVTTSQEPDAADAGAESVKPAVTPPAIKPLEGEAKVGAAIVLRDHLLPVVTKRLVAGLPLVDPFTDDMRLYVVFRRLVASSSDVEMQMILGSLSTDERAAAQALLSMLKASGTGTNQTV